MPNFKSEKISMNGEDVVSWEGLKKDDANQPFELHGHISMHIQVLGDLSGARLVMQGSNATKPENTDWAALIDMQGFPIQFATLDLFKRSNTVPRWVRPAVEGGDENTNLDVMIAMRKG